jgi:hypothetical protein
MAAISAAPITIHARYTIHPWPIAAQRIPDTPKPMAAAPA